MATAYVRLPTPVTDAPRPSRWTHVELRSVLVSEHPAVPPSVAGWDRVVRALRIGDHPLEEVWVGAVDGVLIRSVAMVARGQQHATNVSLPSVLAVPMLAGTNRLTLLHTHPSGIAAPSAEDIALTRAVVAAANACGLWVDDHLIVARGGAIASLRELGYLAEGG